MSIAILDSYLTDLLSIVSSCFINILVGGESPWLKVISMMPANIAGR